MPGQDDFHDLILKVRAGDQDAATSLVSQFESFILRVVRLRMRNRGDFSVLPRRGVDRRLPVGLQEPIRSFEGEGRFDLNQPCRTWRSY